MYDAIIIGCGPAGISAAIYLKRANKNVLVLEKETIGGQMSTSPLIENYPGIESISGTELAFKMYNQMTKLGIKVVLEEVKEVLENEVITEKNRYKTKVIIIATGAKFRRLNIPNEEKFIGKGIHFCTSCDGSFYKDKIVAVIGGANSAVINAIYLSNICKKVYLIYRKENLKCEEILEEKVKKQSNIEMINNSNVIKINGDKNLESIVIDTLGKETIIKLDGIFESIGLEAQTEIAKNLLPLDKHNYFIHNNTITQYENIFVAGDCVSKQVKQITTAVSDGTNAAVLAINYLNKEEK